MKLLSAIMISGQLCALNLSCKETDQQFYIQVVENRNHEKGRWSGFTLNGKPEGLLVREAEFASKVNCNFKDGKLVKILNDGFGRQNYWYCNVLNNKLHGPFSYQYVFRRGRSDIEGQMVRGKKVGLWKHRWIDGTDWLTIDYGSVDEPRKTIISKVYHNIDSLRQMQNDFKFKAIGLKYSCLYNESLLMRIEAENIYRSLRLDTASEVTLMYQFEIFKFLPPDSLKDKLCF